MTCLQVVDFATEYMEGRLCLHDRLAYRLHLAYCRPCRIYIRQLKLVVKALGNTPPQCLCRETKDKLMDSYRKR